MKKIIIAAFCVVALGGMAMAAEVSPSDPSRAGLSSGKSLSQVAVPLASGSQRPEGKAGASTTADKWPAELRRAVKALQTKFLKEFAYVLLLREFPADTPRNKILEVMSGVGQSAIADQFFKFYSGDQGVKILVADMNEEAKNWDDSDEPHIGKNFRKLAKALEDTFLGMADLAKTSVAIHNVTDEGDANYEVLIAHKAGGGFIAFGYFHNPF